MNLKRHSLTAAWLFHYCISSYIYLISAFAFFLKLLSSHCYRSFVYVCNNNISSVFIIELKYPNIYTLYSLFYYSLSNIAFLWVRFRRVYYCSDLIGKHLFHWLCRFHFLISLKVLFYILLILSAHLLRLQIILDMVYQLVSIMFLFQIRQNLHVYCINTSSLYEFLNVVFSWIWQSTLSEMVVCISVKTNFLT